MFISENAQNLQAQMIGDAVAQERKDFEEACTRADQFKENVVRFYLSLSDDDEAEEKTCEKFSITSDTLNYILMDDLVTNGM